MNHLLRTQIDGLVRLELKRYLHARRFIGIYFMAAAPLVILAIRAVLETSRDPAAAEPETYATIYQLLILRLCIFISCGTLFSQAFRGEIFDKTLHFYLLAPVRRSVVVVGKYVGALILSVVLFEVCTVGSFLLYYFPTRDFTSFLMEGAGFSHLARYMIATLLACASYGGVFMLIGLLFKNPGGPLALFLGWESFNYVLPSMLQQLSVIHHLHAIFPVAIDNGPFAIITEPSPAILGIPVLLIGSVLMLAVTGWVLSRTQVTYSAD